MNPRDRYKQEDTDLTRFVDYLVSNIPNEKRTDKNFLISEITKFLQKKLDPQRRFIISAYDHNNQLFVKEFNDTNNLDSSTFLGYNFDKIKMQIRLDDQTDIQNLMKFFEYIRPCMQQMDDEEKINRNRSMILKDIINDDNIQF